MSSPFRIHALGELCVVRGDAQVALPVLKKTRALLAFLALTGRPHRRERLCEIFWELPDDPRGSLRWALSKIRPLVDDPDRQRVVADRERAALKLAPEEIDLVTMRRALNGDAPLSSLRAMAIASAAPLLDGLDLPQLPEYQAWLTSEREDALALRVGVLERITRHPKASDAEALKAAREWFLLDPLSRGGDGARIDASAAGAPSGSRRCGAGLSTRRRGGRARADGPRAGA